MMTRRMMFDRSTRGTLLTTVLMLLLLIPGMVLAAESVEIEKWRRFEIGLGITGGIASLQEEGQGTVLETDGDEATMGLDLTFGYNFNPRLSLELAIVGSPHDTNIENIEVQQGLFSIGLRYHLVESGAIRPYVYGGLSAVGSEIVLKDDDDEELEVAGIGGTFGGGVRLAVSPRFQLDLGLKHTIINYEETDIVVGDEYDGGPVDQTGANTSLSFGMRFLF
ncbi:MAG: porin family protein [bacterium]|nr:porin family protein [bacterium]